MESCWGRGIPAEVWEKNIPEKGAVNSKAWRGCKGQRAAAGGDGGTTGSGVWLLFLAARRGDVDGGAHRAGTPLGNPPKERSAAAEGGRAWRTCHQAAEGWDRGGLATPFFTARIRPHAPC